MSPTITVWFMPPAFRQPLPAPRTAARVYL